MAGTVMEDREYLLLMEGMETEV
ncbi:unnamed protein product [Arabidopsis thaliana]|uniref:Uncharacterized protein n=2 Tax=Arabidopsis thaliana TaxID=3702 RepID=A0A654F3I1_ARATH|nr:uncharacterized protein AT3G02673 [Arabidopsis thaliana]ANM64749.1 hypothetical protein AT3G02673 [Arabidopsis thaliana]CAA0381120.1 unnamed protein product [Arabidopsis thaliana]VYS56083.1 unnamed protein product [Arabidopsis thaliana]|eukprot:NP_001336527.1 hypothetical protein AT3G02673 [Arabidopsis thaliana]